MGSRFAYFDDLICDSCSQIVNRYKNSYMIQTHTTHQIFELIFDRLDDIKKSMETANKRIDKIEKNIDNIQAHSPESVSIDDE